MSKSRVALASLLLLGGFAAGSAPIPADASNPVYYAMAAGSRVLKSFAPGGR